MVDARMPNLASRRALGSDRTARTGPPQAIVTHVGPERANNREEGFGTRLTRLAATNSQVVSASSPVLW